MERIAVFAALQWECRPVLRSLARVRRQALGSSTMWTGEASGAVVDVVRTGIGLARAEAAARALTADHAPALILSAGCAGALADHLSAGDLILAEDVRLPEGQPHPVHPQALARAAAAAGHAALTPHLGSILSSPVILASAERKRAAHATGAIAVEMEGAAIAAVASERGIPFAAVRSILDTADMEIGAEGVFVDPATGALRPLSVAAHVLRHPRTIPALARMKRLADAAELTLNRFFAAFLAA